MLFSVPVLRFNRYPVFLIIILIICFSFFLVTFREDCLPCEPILLYPIQKTRYEEYCLQVYENIEAERMTNNSTELNFTTEYIPYLYSRWKSTSEMPRLLTQCEHALYMHLLSILIEHVFKKHNIQYMMVAATLLGSYTGHDILPWDDDVDLSVSISDRYNLQSIIIDELSSEPYSIIIMQMHTEHNYDKVFFSWCPHAGAMPWRFPFIDICYHEENSTHIWLAAKPSDCPVRREDVFPLTLRPLGSLWLYAPRQPMAHFESRKMIQIETAAYMTQYSRKHERTMMNRIPYIDRSKLKSFYPYVERNCTTNKCIEYLKLGNRTIIQTLTYNYIYRTFLYAETNSSYNAC